MTTLTNAFAGKGNRANVGHFLFTPAAWLPLIMNLLIK
jgi:hypothetical protein